jgi:hypothetical protein
MLRVNPDKAKRLSFGERNEKDTRTKVWLVTAFAIGVATCGAVSGCSKKVQQTSSPEISGVIVDLPKLSQTFTGAPPEVYAYVANVHRHFRYKQYPMALAELDKLAAEPALTEAQKKLVCELIEQTRQVIAKAAQPPGA